MTRNMRLALTGLFGAAAAGVGLYASGVPSTPPAQAAEAVTIPAPASHADERGTEAVADF